MVPGACVVAVLHLALRSLTPDVTFAPWFVDRGVEVHIARGKAKPPWIRGTFDVPVAPDKIIAAVSNFANYKTLFAPALEDVKVLESSANSARLHMVWPYPSPLRDRDAVVLYTIERTPNGGAIVSWQSASRPGDPKRGVRIGQVEGETRIEPKGNGTHVVYTYLGDLGGNFPSSIEERVWKGEPIGYMQALRRAVGLPIIKKQ